MAHVPIKRYYFPNLKEKVLTYATNVNEVKKDVFCEEVLPRLERRIEGLLGEIAFAVHFGLESQINLEVYSNPHKGDEKWDFDYKGYTVDVKTTFPKNSNPCLLINKSCGIPPSTDYFSLVGIYPYSLDKDVIFARVYGFVSSDFFTEDLVNYTDFKYPVYQVFSNQLKTEL